MSVEFYVSQDHIDRVVKCVTIWLGEQELELFKKLSLACDSPIEHLMVAPLICVARGGNIEAQAEIGKYRADFLISKNGRRVVVECDGAAFHHATYEQFQRDKARDKAMREMGYAVVRFSGGQIHADPFGCAERVEAVLDGFVAKPSGTRSLSADVAGIFQ